jgi:V/A-type H+-transporting ATPase subunit A
MNASNGEVIKVSGPLVVARGLTGARMYEMVRVGQANLFREIIEIRGGEYSIQVYEETEGIGPGQPLVRTGEPLSVELGPGLIRSIYDGVQRPRQRDDRCAHGVPPSQGSGHG